MRASICVLLCVTSFAAAPATNPTTMPSEAAIKSAVSADQQAVGIEHRRVGGDIQKEVFVHFTDGKVDLFSENKGPGAN
jgi:hypothetical protein